MNTNSHITLSWDTDCQPVKGNALFDVETRWKGGLKSHSTCHPCLINGLASAPEQSDIIADEPVSLGGEGAAPGPQELMLSAFNACITAVYITTACRMGVTIEKLNIRTRGELDLSAFPGTGSEPAPGHETIRYLISVKGSATPAQFEQIHQAVIAASPTRWVVANNMLIEGDQIVES